MDYYFTKEDFQALCRKLKELDDYIAIICKETGEAALADTWHDNFSYEEGVRQQTMYSTRLRELVQIRNNARIIDPPPPDGTVCFGSIVRIKDLDTGEEQTFKIGSFMVFTDKEAISYNSPIAKIIIGARAGDIKTGMVEKEKKTLLILKVE